MDTLGNYQVLVIFPTTLASGTRYLPGGVNCDRVAWSVKELENDLDETGGPCRSGGARAQGLTVMVGETLPKWAKSLEYEHVAACALAYG